MIMIITMIMIIIIMIVMKMLIMVINAPPHARRTALSFVCCC